MFWLLLPAVPLMLIVSQLSPMLVTPPQLWTWTVGRSLLLVMIPTAVAATGAALEAARLRARRTENMLNVRSYVRVAFHALWPSYVCGGVLQLIAVGIVALNAWGGDSDIPWGMIIAISAILLFHTCLGFAVGAVLRPVFGIPVALAASYAWLGFTGTIPMFELRHLAGLVLETCCFYDQQPILESLVSATSFSILAAAGLVLLAAVALRIVANRVFAVATLGALLIVAGLSAGLIAAHGLPPSAAEPRDTRELICTEGAITVCLFPEQSDREDTTHVQSMIQRVRDRGVLLPTTVVSSTDTNYDSERIRLRYIHGMSDEQLAGSLASDLPEQVCQGDNLDSLIARDVVRATSVVWLEMTMLGSDAASLNLDDLDIEVEESVRNLLQTSPADQAMWVNSAISSLRDCAVPLPGVP